MQFELSIPEADAILDILDIFAGEHDSGFARAIGDRLYKAIEDAKGYN